jgi:hypothetical protein
MQEMDACAYHAVAKIEACRVALSGYLHQFRASSVDKARFLPQLRFYLKEGRSLISRYNEIEIKDRLISRLDSIVRKVAQRLPATKQADIHKFRKIGTTNLQKSLASAVREYSILGEVVTQSEAEVKSYQLQRARLSQSAPLVFPPHLRRPQKPPHSPQPDQLRRESLQRPQLAQAGLAIEFRRATLTYMGANGVRRQIQGSPGGGRSEVVEVRRIRSADSPRPKIPLPVLATLGSEFQGRRAPLQSRDQRGQRSERPLAKRVFRTHYKIDDHGRHVEGKSGNLLAHLLETLGISGVQIGDKVSSMTIGGYRAQPFDTNLFINALRNLESVTLKISRGRGSFEVQPDPHAVRSYLVKHPLRVVVDSTTPFT